MVGRPAAAEPCSSAYPGLDTAKPASVLTAWTETKPWPCDTVAGIGTISCVALTIDGVSGPALTGPLAVATKKLISGFALKPRPLMVRVLPTSTGWLRLVITGWPGGGVGVGAGTVGPGVIATQAGGVGVGVGFAVAVRVGAGVGDGVGAIAVGVGFRVAVCVGNGVGVRVGVAVGVLPGVAVEIKVGGPVTLNCWVAVAASSVASPAKLAVCEVS